MNTLIRTLKTAVAVLLACTMGSLPSCGTMGGGMRYFAPDKTWIAATLA